MSEDLDVISRELAEEDVEMADKVSANSIDTGELEFNNATIDAHNQIVEGLGKVATLFSEGRADSLELEPGGELASTQMIVGAGLGMSESTIGVEPGIGTLQIYTAEPMPRENVINYAISVLGVSALEAPEVQVVVVHTGPIDAQAHRFRLRPAPGGISIGHLGITAGTFGCLVKGRTHPRNSRLLILSNNHVLANVNKGKAGDPIVQPGVYDGGHNPADRVALLERFVPIRFGSRNRLDCATAWADPSLVRPELMYLKSPNSPGYFKVQSTVQAASVGLVVGKTGRTTQLKSGRVDAVGVTINVNMGGGRIAQFVDQISIVGLNGQFSAGGDSGSLIWSWAKPHKAVGLLFAGGGKHTFANPINTVLNTLDVDIVSDIT